MGYRKTAATDAFTTTLERVIQITAEPTGVLIGNKIADRIMKVSKNISPRNYSGAITNEHNKERPQERYISPEEKQKIIDELKLK